MAYNSSKTRRTKKLKKLAVNSDSAKIEPSKAEKKRIKRDRRNYLKAAHKIQNSTDLSKSSKVCKFVCCSKSQQQYISKLSRRERKKQKLLRKTEQKSKQNKEHIINIKGHFIFDTNSQSFKIIFSNFGNFKFSKEEIQMIKNNFMKKLLKKQHHCAKNPKKSPAEYSSITSMKIQVSM